uniref:Exonuclease domain-containing protein n=1 Tax=Spumella elongata TaxID=89044 RepID=A0A7S3HDU8_9STRA|mmetsp:Transcript_47234/g.82481  ORF Transcript_47234/g.82481 Transcript_47234/m.82481 type:complete len:623 (+) Transcript_47234:1-1869(+)
MATTARKRKAHLLAQQEEDGEEPEGTESTCNIAAPEVVSNKKSKSSVLPPPPAPTNISDLINMYTPQALKTANSNTNTSSSGGVNSGVTPSKGVVTGNSGVKPPLPPLPPPPTSTSNAIHSASKTNVDTSVTTNSVVATVTTPIEPYQCTLIPLHTIKTPLEMVALDCEMCTTSQGLELTRLTVLCPLNGVVYDTLVRPESDITDYHTEFSGITQDQLVNVTTTLKDVQDTLRQLISDRTIIVGHSADTDLKVLQLVHSRVIDTSALFPHPTGLPYKHSLKKLAKDYLHKDIQDGKEGHDSVQDAAIALELAFLKAKQGESGSFICPWLDDPVPKCSIFEPLLSCESSTGPSLSVSVHGIPSVLGYGTPVWEDFAFGYRPEGDSCLNVEHCRAALQARLESLNFNENTNSAEASELCNRLHAQIEQLRHQRHGTTEEAVTYALQDLNTLSSSCQDNDGDGITSMKKSLTIVEMCCGDEMQPEDDAHSMHSASDAGYNAYDQDYSGGEESGTEGKEKEEEESFLRGPPRRVLTGLARIDHYAQQLLQAAPANTLLLVVTQGNFKAMRQLASRKLRNRWEQAALKRKQSLVGLGRVYWDASLDESRLIAAAAHATAGAVFLVKK